jgi:hypothetical protein
MLVLKTRAHKYRCNKEQKMSNRPREIYLLKDVTRFDTWSTCLREIDQPIWKFGRVTNADTWDEDSTVFWQADLTAAPWASDVIFYEIIEKLNSEYPQTLDYSFKLQSAVAGGKTFGLDGGIHNDKDIDFNDMGDGYMTLCFFPNEEWNPEWGGEFQFFDENGNVIASYYPMPNTCLVFDSNIPHRGLAPSRSCKKLRKYISYKTFVSKKWYLEANPDVQHIEVGPEVEDDAENNDS